MIHEEAIAGCVLAGGKSARMGRDKAMLNVGSVTLIERAATLLKTVFPSVVVSSDRRDTYEFLNLPILPDIKKDCGPLGGIHAALIQTTADFLFVLAVDMPFVSSDVIRYIVKNANSNTHATVPSLGGRVHPLCGVYSRRGLPVIERALENEMYKLQLVLAELKASVVSITPELPFYAPHLFDNLNDVEDFERALLNKTA